VTLDTFIIYIETKFYSPIFIIKIEYKNLMPISFKPIGILKKSKNIINTFCNPIHTITDIFLGMFIRPDETNLYTTLEPTLSSNPNVYFQRSGAVHPGILY